MAAVPKSKLSKLLDRTLTQEGYAAEGGNIAAPKLGPIRWFLEEVRFLLRVVISSADRFYWDNGFSKAASLAYTTLFALVPLTMLAFGLLSTFALSNEHLPEVREFIFRQFVPQLDLVNELLANLSQFSERIQSVSLLALSFIVITSILLLNSVEYALNEVWQVYEARTIANRIVIFCAIIVIAPVLALSLYFFASYRLQPILEGLGFGSYANVVYASMIPYFIDFAAFLFIYYYVPKAPVRFASAVFGGALAAILFGLAKSGFAHYIQTFSSYDKIYGALASIPVFLFWLYLAWTIVLFGAEVSYQAQNLPRRGKLWKRTVMSIGDGRMLLAVQALVQITRGFNLGRKLPNDLELAEQLGCSSVLLKPALDALEKAAIIQRGDSRSMPLTLMKSPEAVSLEEIRSAVFNGSQRVHFPDSMSRVFAAFHNDRPLTEVTLAELAQEPDRKNNA